MRRGAVRVAQYAFVLWTALTLNFVLPHLAPGDPVSYLAGEANSLSEVHRAKIRAEYRLDGNLAEQYSRYWQRLARADLGVSVSHSRPVSEVLASRLPWTVALVGTATLASAAIGILLGAVAAQRRGRGADIGLVSGLLLVDAMPAFWIGMVLVAVFAVNLGWFPSFGAVPLAQAGGTAWLVEVARRSVLPFLTVILATVGGTFLMTRAAMIPVLGAPYVVAARAKGLSTRRVLYGHALRNAVLPVYTHLTLGLGAVFSGAVVVETVFAYPGLGRLLYEAVVARDYPLLQGAFLLVTVAVLTANLVADLTYPRLDPRVRPVLSGAGR